MSEGMETEYKDVFLEIEENNGKNRMRETYLMMTIIMEIKI